MTQLGEESKALNLYYLSSCWGAFSVGEKKMYARTAEGDFILRMMREAMNAIIADNTHLTARCEAIQQISQPRVEGVHAGLRLMAEGRQQDHVVHTETAYHLQFVLQHVLG